MHVFPPFFPFCFHFSEEKQLLGLPFCFPGQRSPFKIDPTLTEVDSIAVHFAVCHAQYNNKIKKIGKNRCLVF